MSFFQDNKGNKSMMRLGFIAIHLMALILIIAVAIAIVNRIAPDYSGIAVLLGGIAAILGVAYAGKVKQKQTEDKGGDV